jgi:Zn-dependent protease with chaperone function
MLAALAALACVPVLVGLAAARGARRVAVRLAPPAAAVLLTALALTVALATGLILCLGAVVALAELTGLGHWAPAVVRAQVPLSPALGIAGGVLAAALLASACGHAVRVLVRSRRAAAAARALAPVGAGLVLVDDPDPVAYAVPGRPGRIVVSIALLRSLPPVQRRALLAHEAAHLRYRHHVYVQLGRLAAAANPLLRPVAAAVDLAVERWADEVAAGEVGDRRAVGQAVAAVALGQSRPGPVLAGSGIDVVARVGLLLRPPPDRRLRAAVLLLVTAAAGCWLAAAVVIDQVHALMELAELL